jgi:hypothetical protein
LVRIKKFGIPQENREQFQLRNVDIHSNWDEKMKLKFTQEIWKEDGKN